MSPLPARRWIVGFLVVALMTGAAGAIGCDIGGDDRVAADCGRLDWRAWADPKSDELPPSDGRTVRQRMADRMIECGALEGRPLSWIRRHLGKAKPYGFMGERLVDYVVGTCTDHRGCLFAGDTEYLTIYLDGKDRVEDVELTDT